jgi:hypothetical protein
VAIHQKAQHHALSDLVRENLAEYQGLYQEAIEAGFGHNDSPVLPKAQPWARITLSKRHPTRYRQLYVEHIERLSGQ